MLAILFVAGCASPAASSPPAVAPTPAETIFVRHLAEPGGCPLPVFPQGPITFRIDPTAAWPQQIVAVDADGERHDVFWSEGFTGGTVSDPVVRDPAGEVIARDGEVLIVPNDGQQPRLHGYMVCSGSDRIYVLLEGRE